MSDALDAQIGPIKGNPLYKGLAKFFSGLDSYARDPNNIVAQALPLPEGAGVGITSGWSSLLGLPEAARFWDDRHGGFPLTSGKGQTLRLAPDVLEGGLASLPFISAPANTARKTALKAADKLLDLEKGMPKGQLNALYGGTPRSPKLVDPEITLSHGTSAGKLSTLRSTDDLGKDLPLELYNLSLALTRGDLSRFSSPDTWLIPKPGRFQPKLDQTIITATDSFSPRHGDALGKRIDNGTLAYDKSRGYVSKRDYLDHLREFANSRLADQFVPVYPAGGIHQEGQNALGKGLSRFRNFQEAYNLPEKKARELGSSVFDKRVGMSPHFQSFEDYAASPYGGKLLGNYTGHSQLAQAENEGLALTTSVGLPYEFSGLGYIDKLRMLASGKTLNGAPIHWAAADNRVSPTEVASLAKKAQRILQQIKTAPSDYGEVKRFGQTKLNPDTFSGIVTSSSSPWLETAALRRGLAFERLPASASAADRLDAGRSIQASGKMSPILTRGLAKRQEPRASQAAADDELLAALSSQNPPQGQTFGSPFLDETASTKSWEMGHFDYFPEGQLSLLTDYAIKTGNDPLKAAVHAYKTSPDYLNSGEPPAHLTETLLKELDAVKSGWETQPLPSFDTSGLGKLLSPGVSAKKSSPIKDYLAVTAPSNPDSWITPGELKVKFPELTSEQAEALGTHALNQYFQQNYGSHWGQSVAESLAKLKTLFPE